MLFSPRIHGAPKILLSEIGFKQKTRCKSDIDTNFCITPKNSKIMYRSSRIFCRFTLYCKIIEQYIVSFYRN